MFVLIVGGGRTGSHLASLLLQQNHTVRLIEHRPDILTTLHREIPTEVIIEGDGTDPQMLEIAGIRSAQVVAAVTSDDADNLVVTSLARFHYNVNRIIGRINNPRNSWLFTKDFGVDVSLNNADIMAKLIEEEMSIGDMMIMLKVRRGQYSFVEEKIAAGAQAIGRAIKDLALPEHCVISGIVRNGELILPRGVTQLEEGDEIFAIVDDPARLELDKLLGRPGAVPPPAAATMGHAAH